MQIACWFSPYSSESRYENPLRKVCFLYPFKMAKTNVLTTQHKTMKNNLSISQTIWFNTDFYFVNYPEVNELEA